MDGINKIQLNPLSILSVPIQMYDNDFTFFINGEEYKTSRLLSDLLSPNICKIHFNDPTFDKITINTQHPGDFSRFLNLQNFNEQNISKSELPFFSEIIEILGSNSFNCRKDEGSEITIENVFSRINQNQKNFNFYDDEIEFISSNFYLLCEIKEEELESLPIDALISIITNAKLQLNDEDQLLYFINKLYSKNSMYSILYEKVVFVNVSKSSMNEFVSIYDINDITTDLWRSLSDRLKQIEFQSNKARYKKHELSFQFSEGNEFHGILNYLRSKSGDKVENEVSITASSLYQNEEKFHPKNLVFFDDSEKWFCSQDVKNSWVCFDFKELHVCPTNYSLKSANWGPNNGHPKSWVIEASNDEKSWEVIDEQDGCRCMNGRYIVHTFSVKNSDSKEFRYIRMRQTGCNWCGDDYLGFKSFEIYGQLI